MVKCDVDRNDMGKGVESNLEHPRIDGIGSTKSKLGFGRALLYHSV